VPSETRTDCGLLAVNDLEWKTASALTADLEEPNSNLIGIILCHEGA
jgi:hypothetical protein